MAADPQARRRRRARLGRRGPPAERQDRPHQRRGQGEPRRGLDQPGAGRRRPRSTSPARSRRRCRRTIEPMLATLADKAFDDDDWLFEIKWDGYRVEAVVDDGKAEHPDAQPQRRRDLLPEAPRRRRPLDRGRSRRSSMARSSRSTTTGRPDFSLLQERSSATRRRPASSTRSSTCSTSMADRCSTSRSRTASACSGACSRTHPRVRFAVARRGRGQGVLRGRHGAAASRAWSPSSGARATSRAAGRRPG